MRPWICASSEALPRSPSASDAEEGVLPAALGTLLAEASNTSTSCKSDVCARSDSAE